MKPSLLVVTLALPLCACHSGTGLAPFAGDSDLGDVPTAQDLAAGGDTIVLQMTPFTVAPGQEVYKCQNFANPVGADFDVRSFASHMTPGSHHMLAFYEPGLADGPLEDCSGLEFAATPYGSQLPDDSVTFPPGVAALVKQGTGIRIQSHYLNATLQPINAQVTLTIHLAAPGTITQHAGVAFFVNDKFSIPPGGQPVTSSKTCNIPVPLKLIRASSHMHQHATHFIATGSAGTIYETNQWSDPARRCSIRRWTSPPDHR
jgi:hypothetical protein